MKTRTSKIAQLPKPIRDQLNQRLQNGQQGPELLTWLNSLPETKTLLAEKFDNALITKQNLSEWRHGGYEEWLRAQEREHRIQRLTEQGMQLEKRELGEEIFEHSARIALAEWMADMDTLHQLSGEDRAKRLHTLTADLARLQNAYNRSRWAALAWHKWKDRFLGPDDCHREPETNNSNPATRISEPPDPRTADVQSAVSPTCSRQSAAPTEPEREIKNPTPEIPPKNPPLDKALDSQPTADATKVLPLPRGLSLLGKKRKESAAGGGPEGAERAGASESLGRGEGEGNEKESKMLPPQGQNPKESPTVQPSPTQSTGGQSTPNPQNAPPATSLSVEHSMLNVECSASTVECSASPLESSPQPKTTAEIIQQNILKDFLRQAALRKSFYALPPAIPANNP